MFKTTPKEIQEYVDFIMEQENFPIMHIINHLHKTNNLPETYKINRSLKQQSSKTLEDLLVTLKFLTMTVI